GSITRPSGNLNIQGTGAGNALAIAIGSSGAITASSGNVTFNGSAAGAISTTTIGAGTISAGGTGGQVVLNGGTGAGAAQVNVSAASITGLVSGSGSSFQASAASGTLSVG